MDEDLYDDMVASAVPNDIHRTSDLSFETLHRKYMRSRQRMQHMLATISDLSEKNKELDNRNKHAEAEVKHLQENLTILQGNFKHLTSVARYELKQMQSRLNTFQERNQNSSKRWKPPAYKQVAEVSIKFEDEQKREDLLAMLYTEKLHIYSENRSSSKEASSSSKNGDTSNLSQGVSFDCRPFHGPKTPPTPSRTHRIKRSDASLEKDVPRSSSRGRNSPHSNSRRSNSPQSSQSTSSPQKAKRPPVEVSTAPSSGPCYDFESLLRLSHSQMLVYVRSHKDTFFDFRKTVMQWLEEQSSVKSSLPQETTERRSFSSIPENVPCRSQPSTSACVVPNAPSAAKENETFTYKQPSSSTKESRNPLEKSAKSSTKSTLTSSQPFQEPLLHRPPNETHPSMSSSSSTKAATHSWKEPPRKRPREASQESSHASSHEKLQSPVVSKSTSKDVKSKFTSEQRYRSPHEVSDKVPSKEHKENSPYKPAFEDSLPDKSKRPSKLDVVSSQASKETSASTAKHKSKVHVDSLPDQREMVSYSPREQSSEKATNASSSSKDVYDSSKSPSKTSKHSHQQEKVRIEKDAGVDSYESRLLKGYSQGIRQHRDSERIKNELGRHQKNHDPRHRQAALRAQEYDRLDEDIEKMVLPDRSPDPPQPRHKIWLSYAARRDEENRSGSIYSQRAKARHETSSSSTFDQDYENNMSMDTHVRHTRSPEENVHENSFSLPTPSTSKLLQQTLSQRQESEEVEQLDYEEFIEPFPHEDVHEVCEGQNHSSENIVRSGFDHEEGEISDSEEDARMKLNGMKVKKKRTQEVLSENPIENSLPSQVVVARKGSLSNDVPDIETKKKKKSKRSAQRKETSNENVEENVKKLKDMTSRRRHTSPFNERHSSVLYSQQDEEPQVNIKKKDKKDKKEKYSHLNNSPNKDEDFSMHEEENSYREKRSSHSSRSRIPSSMSQEESTVSTHRKVTLSQPCPATEESSRSISSNYSSRVSFKNHNERSPLKGKPWKRPKF